MCAFIPLLLLSSGANILVSAFTITVIAVDRWRSVSNTNPNDALTYRNVFIVIAALWFAAFVGKKIFFNKFNSNCGDVGIEGIDEKRFEKWGKRNNFSLPLRSCANFCLLL